MKITKLTKEEVQFLRTMSSDIISPYLDKAHFDTKSSAFVLILTIKDLEIISDSLCNILSIKGITNDEINDYGKQIDELINKFNPYE